MPRFPFDTLRASGLVLRVNKYLLLGRTDYSVQRSLPRARAHDPYRYASATAGFSWLVVHLSGASQRSGQDECHLDSC